MTDETTEKKPRTKRTIADRAAELRESAEKALARAVERESKAQNALLEAVEATGRSRNELRSLGGSTAEDAQQEDEEAGEVMHTKKRVK
jgi:hypothetical protein